MSVHIEYYPNGQLKEEGAYKDGNKDGLWTEWWEDEGKKQKDCMKMAKK
tara:strand:+ start:179 stop:325 length:147 start_codon:yes stop_codon:yes gene_type:complete